MHKYVKDSIAAIYKNTHCTAILYFQKSKMYALRHGQDTPIELKSFDRSYIDDMVQVPVNERFVFFSPAYCRGSDLVLMQDANALVMIRKECQLADTLQAIMRMRQFGTQRVDMLLEQNLMDYFDVNENTLTVDTWWQKIRTRSVSSKSSNCNIYA